MPQVDPMIVAIWCGNSKPILSEYFEPLINELKTILNGVTLNSRHIAIRMGNIICDTPARAFVKGLFIVKHISVYIQIYLEFTRYCDV